jgi:glutathione synthase/RimK-type ligase-like ATP-grasp enzyme
LVGIPREAVYSPGKVDADRDILEQTASELAARGVDPVRIVEPEKLSSVRRADLVFAMCQGPAALHALRRLERTGVPLVHGADPIEACHRQRMLPLLTRAGVTRPDARLVRSDRPGRAALDWVESRGAQGVWVKRGDVHATEAGDVVRIEGAVAARQALTGLAARGVRHAVLEAHVPGLTVKFYGVVGTGFFRAYEGDGRDPLPAPPAWVELGEAGARALGLAIYGGDLIVDAAGRPWLVDVNDWPSFSRCRQDAAVAIAQYLLARLRVAREAQATPCPPDEEFA